MKAARAAFAGLLVAAALPPWGWWPLAFVGVALFEGALDDHSSRRSAFGRGWLFGLAWLAPGMAWMWFLSAPGYVIASALFAGFHGVAALAAPPGRWRPLARAAAHTLAEALRMVIPFGGVPLATLGIAEVAGPIGGLARLGGVLLITWATFQVGFSCGTILRWWPSRRSNPARPRVPVVALGAVAVLVALAAMAPSGHDTGRTLKVAAIQGGGPQGTRAVSSDSQVVIDRHLRATGQIPTAAGPDGDLDVVVWPENVIDVDGEPFDGSSAEASVSDQAGRLAVPLVVGITEDAGPNSFTNAQVVVTPDGDVVSRYDKVRRVPFGEYMPFRDVLDALGAPVDLVPNDAVAGTTPGLLTVPTSRLGDVPVGVAISWEVFFPGRVREGVKAGGQVVINPTNGSSYTWTVLQTQQVASSRLRAIETGRWVIQVAPTGFSAFVSPSGEVFDRTDISEQAVIRREIPLRTGTTIAVRLGERPVIAAVAAVLALAWWASRRRTDEDDEDGEVTPRASV